MSSCISTATSTGMFHNKHKLLISKNVEEQRRLVEQLLLSLIQQQADPAKNVLVGFSGGSMPAFLAPLLAQLPDEVISRMRLFPVDERLVPLTSEDSNSGALLQLLPMDKFAPKILSVPEELVEEKEGGGFQAAQQFQRQLRSLDPQLNANGFPVFDLLLLGLGPDGHTCSLFPGHALLGEDKLWVSHLEDSPKLPPRRITLTLPVLSAAENVAFIANGAGKADVIRAILVEDDQQLPPSRIRRTDAQKPIEWFIDEEAGSKIDEQK